MAIRLTFILGLALLAAAWISERHAQDTCMTHRSKATCLVAMNR